MNRSLKKWELIGIPFIVVSGSALHFTFEWSGYWTPIAVIAAVNESVWEHLKLAFWPGLAWALVEFVVLQPSRASFWWTKGYGLLVAPVLITAIFYGYTSLLGTNILALDIATFVAAVGVGQFVSAKLLNATTTSANVRGIGLGLLLFQIAAYPTFTWYPPPFALFEDGRDGVRGIPDQTISASENAVELTYRDAMSRMSVPRSHETDGVPEPVT